MGAQLALFPEAFISAYPRGLDFGAVVGGRTEEGREDFRRYWESSVDVPGPAVDELSRAARRNNIYLIGVVANTTWMLLAIMRGPTFLQLHVDEQPKQPVTIQRVGPAVEEEAPIKSDSHAATHSAD